MSNAKTVWDTFLSTIYPVLKAANLVLFETFLAVGRFIIWHNAYVCVKQETSLSLLHRNYLFSVMLLPPVPSPLSPPPSPSTHRGRICIILWTCLKYLTQSSVKLCILLPGDALACWFMIGLTANSDVHQ